MESSSLVLSTADDLRQLIRSEISLLSGSENIEYPKPQPTWGWISNREFLERGEISKTTAQRLRSSGRLRYSKIGGKIYYRRSDVEALLEANLRNPTSEVSR